MLCKECGAEIAKKSKFCNVCGCEIDSEKSRIHLFIWNMQKKLLE